MADDFLSAILAATKEHAGADKRLRKSALSVLSAFQKRKKEFDRQKKRVDDDIERKARFTKHRITL
jgi:hypothetical protein